jgi:hypothetical protein
LWEGECAGFDTETDKGYARVLASHDAVIEVSSIDDALAFLSMLRFRSTLNVFYNLAFDAEVLLKWDRDLLSSVASTGEGVHGPYRVKYIPRKLLRITKYRGKPDKRGKLHGDCWAYYDAAQYFRMPLAAASKKYLGEEADLDMKEDRARLFELHSIDEIKTYCQHDALLAKKLADKTVQSLRAVGLKTKRLTSAGQLSQIYALQNADLPCSYHLPRRVASMYWESFKGGWTDVYRKGTMKAWNYDIRSAYPYHLSCLPDIREGLWREGLDEGAAMGVVHARINRGVDDFSPVPFRDFGCSMYYQVNTPVDCYLTFAEYFALEKHCDLEPLEAHAFYPSGGKKPYAELVRKLFERKEALRGDDHAYRSAKELINSLYGKTCERRKGPRGWKGGRLFNPCYAAETTGRTRAQIFDAFYALRRSLICVATDGVFCKEPAHVNENGELGSWSRELDGEELTLIQSGVYESPGRKLKARGLMHVESLRKELDCDGDSITVQWERPFHAKESLAEHDSKALGRKTCFEDVGVFLPVEKSINVNHDRKRWWDHKVTCRDLLEKEVGSNPIPLDLVA